MWHAEDLFMAQAKQVKSNIFKYINTVFKKDIHCSFSLFDAQLPNWKCFWKIYFFGFDSVRMRNFVQNFCAVYLGNVLNLWFIFCYLKKKKIYFN